MLADLIGNKIREREKEKTERQDYLEIARYFPLPAKEKCPNQKVSNQISSFPYTDLIKINF